MSALPSRTPSPNRWVGGFGQQGVGRDGTFYQASRTTFCYDPVDMYVVELPAGVIIGYFQSQSLQESRAENPRHSEEEIELNLLCVVCEYCRWFWVV